MNKKITNKIIVLMMTMLILANTLIGTNISMASTWDEIITVKKGSEYGEIIKDENAWLRFFRVYYEGNGGVHPVYCYDKSLQGVESVPSGEYQVEPRYKITDLRLWRIIINSDPYKSFLEMGCETPAQAYVATKAAIDIILYNKDFSKYSAESEKGEIVLKAIEKLLEIAEDETIQPPTTNIEINALNEWKLENINGQVYLTQEFEVENEKFYGRYTVGLKGEIPSGARITSIYNAPKTNFHNTENFKVIIPREAVNETAQIEIEAEGEIETLPIYNGIAIGEYGGYQNYIITGIRTEMGYGNATFEYSPIGGKLVITKVDTETEENLSGVKFNIYDTNKNLLYENIETDENGDIIIYNLLTGTYYVEETEALEGYKKIDRMLEIDVIEDSTSNMIISNTKTQIIETEKHNITVEIVETNKETNNVIVNEHYKEVVNNNTTNNTEINNTHIDTITNNNTENKVENNIKEIITTTNNETKIEETNKQEVIQEKTNEEETKEKLETTKPEEQIQKNEEKQEETKSQNKIENNITTNKKLPKTGM